MAASTRWLTLALAAFFAGPAATSFATVIPDATLPRFTEEREAAALYFLRKNAPDLLNLVEQWKKENPSRYRQEIRAVFQVTEMLADLQDDARRHDLELEIWKHESKAHALAARMPGLNEAERRKTDEELQRLARELVLMDVQVLELKAEQAEKEFGEIRDELTKARYQIPMRAKARYDQLLEQGRRRRK